MTGQRGPRFVDAAQLAGALSWTEAVDALERAFRLEAPGDGPARSHIAVPDGELLMMPVAGATGVGVKLVTLAPGNPSRRARSSRPPSWTEAR